MKICTSVLVFIHLCALMIIMTIYRFTIRTLYGAFQRNCITWKHCKDTIPKIRNKYPQKRNCTATVPISTVMCLWAIYISPRLTCLFCYRKICGNWYWGCAIARKGMHKWDFRCFEAVQKSLCTKTYQLIDSAAFYFIVMHWCHCPPNICIIMYVG